MKNKRALVGQHILDGMGDIELGYEYVENLMPLIGEVVLAFNGLEATLDSLLCETISDRSDQKGLLVLHNMMYATKVDLYKRFNDDFVRMFDWSIPEYENLISNLKECGTLRNRVVHANWEYTDEDGFTQVRYRMSKEGVEHELWQFSIEAMIKIISKIYEIRTKLGEFDEECSQRISQWNYEIQDRNDERNRSE
jgi:hypothetical protein